MSAAKMQRAAAPDFEETDFTGRLGADINYRAYSMLGKRARQENGLVELTKKFIQLIKDAPEQCVDLNEAVNKLEV